jgi:N-methylhydantoinase B
LSDPASLEIAWRRLVSIADEMAASLRNTAFSSVVREANDFACAILTPKGELLVEYSRSVPVFTNVLNGAAEAMLAALGHDHQPGDVLITNDPWAGNTHLADFITLTPVWIGDDLVAYTASICHVADVGGSSEGAFAQDIFEEGFCVPPIKLRRAGELDQTLLTLLRRNVRVPELVLGDIHALVAANDFGARRLQEYLRDQPSGTLAAITEAIANASESAMRTAIRQLPDGRYRGSVELDGFEAPKAIQVSITVTDDELAADFEGTSPQSEYGINSGAPSVAYTLYSLKCVLSPSLPNNAWTYRPIEVCIPKGSLLNPEPPAPLSANFPAHLIQAALYIALYDGNEAAVMAPSGAPMWVLSLRGKRGDHSFASILCFNGGQGALLGKHGRSCLSMPSNVGNTPIESAEAECPIVYERKAIARGTGGQGRWQGGNGQEVVLRSIHDQPIDVVFLSERLEHAAPGLGGGSPGSVGLLLLDGQPVKAPKGRARLRPGSRISLRTPGGGGFGATLAGAARKNTTQDSNA